MMVPCLCRRHQWKLTMMFFLLPGHLTTLGIYSDNCDCRHILGMWACAFPIPVETTFPLCVHSSPYFQARALHGQHKEDKGNRPTTVIHKVLFPLHSGSDNDSLRWASLLAFHTRAQRAQCLDPGNSPEAPDEHWCHLKWIPLANTLTNGAWK